MNDQEKSPRVADDEIVGQSSHQDVSATNGTTFLGLLSMQREELEDFFADGNRSAVTKFFLFHLILPFVWLRETLDGFSFQFWEDEAADFFQLMSFLFFSLAKITIVVGLFAVPFYFYYKQTDHYDSSARKSLAVSPRKSADSKSRQSELDASSRAVMPDSIAAALWINRYRELDEYVPSTNLKKLDVLGQKIEIGKRLAKIEQHEMTASEFLLDDSIEFSLVCLKGELSVPDAITELLKIEPKLNSASEKFAVLRQFADIILAVIDGKASSQPESIESDFESLMARDQLALRQQEQLEKFANISKTSDYFGNGNRIHEIYRTEIEKKESHE